MALSREDTSDSALTGSRSLSLARGTSLHQVALSTSTIRIDQTEVICVQLGCSRVAMPPLLNLSM